MTTSDVDAWRPEPDPLLERLMARAGFLLAAEKAVLAGEADRTRIDVLNEIVVTQQQTIEGLKTACAGLHAAAATVVVDVAPSPTETVALQAQERLEAEARQLKAELLRLKEENLQLRDETVHLRSEASHLAASTAAANRLVESLQKSTSWRLTAPLRAVRTRLGSK